MCDEQSDIETYFRPAFIDEYKKIYWMCNANKSNSFITSYFIEAETIGLTPLWMICYCAQISQIVPDRSHGSINFISETIIEKNISSIA